MRYDKNEIQTQLKSLDKPMITFNEQKFGFQK